MKDLSREECKVLLRHYTDEIREVASYVNTGQRTEVFYGRKLGEFQRLCDKIEEILNYLGA